MTTLRPSLPPSSSSSASSAPPTASIPAQSPAKRSNPFARPTVSHSPSSFTRSSLLPTLPSPSRPFNPLATPSDKLISTNGLAASTFSAGRPRTGWRILWRGGLEIGTEGWRFDGGVTSRPTTEQIELTDRRHVHRATVLPPGNTLCAHRKPLRRTYSSKYVSYRLAFRRPSCGRYRPLSLVRKHERAKVLSGERLGRAARE